MDVPTRISNQIPTSNYVGSVGFMIRRAIAFQTPFVNYINMGQRYSDDTNAVNNVEFATNYIAKLESFGTNITKAKVLISASAGGYPNDRYLLDDEIRFLGMNNGVPTSGSTLSMTWSVTAYYAGLTNSLIDASKVDFLQSTSATQRHGTNIAGYMSWGFYGWYYGYAWSNNVAFHGSASWYIMATIESYNGFLVHHNQGTYWEWFAPNAFGRSNYEGTPVGAVCHVGEPGADGANNGTIYFGLWAKGKCFAIAAWSSAQTPNILVVGDPLTTR
jgi:hypothetical protein